MREIRQRNKLKRIFFSRPIFVLLAVLVGMLAVSVFGVYKKSHNAVLKNRVVEEDLKNLDERKKSLEANISQLKTDLGIEKELRKKFPVKKPDEEFVVIIDKTDEEQKQQNETQLEKTTFFKKLLNLLK